MSDQPISSAGHVERVLAYMVAGIVGLSILSFIAILVASFAGVTKGQCAAGFWPIVNLVPLIGLPIGFVLIIVLLIVSIRRRSRPVPDGTGAGRDRKR